MNEPLSLGGATTSLVLPWVLGLIWMLVLLGRSHRWNYWIVAGHGYLFGMLFTTLVMRAWNTSVLDLSFSGLTAVLLLFTIAGITVLRVCSPESPVRHNSPTRWERVAVAALVLIIAYRYSGIAHEILLRPLYPWDAWMNWAPKAINWFYDRQLTDFISPGHWLEYTGEKLAYTTGATNAWKYPVTIPLIQLWVMLGAGSADQTLSNLPWLFVPIAFALSLYGHLKLSGASTLLATIACYVFLSIPYVNVHTALAGYADIWLAVYFGAAVLALHEWQQERHWSWAGLVLFFAFSCTQLKLPGLVLGGIILSVFLFSLANFGRKGVIITASVIVFLLMYAVLLGISFNLPLVGQVEISGSNIILPYLGSFEIGYKPAHRELLDSILFMSNWNLFWYVFVAVLMTKIYFKDFLRPASLELQSIFLISAFLLFTFYFTRFSQFVLDYTTVNRVLLYPVTAIVFYVFFSIHEWIATGSHTRSRTLNKESGN